MQAVRVSPVARWPFWLSHRQVSLLDLPDDAVIGIPAAESVRCVRGGAWCVRVLWAVARKRGPMSEHEYAYQWCSVCRLETEHCRGRETRVVCSGTSMRIAQERWRCCNESEHREKLAKRRESEAP
jgi:hypothetical protein